MRHQQRLPSRRSFNSIPALVPLSTVTVFRISSNCQPQRFRPSIRSSFCHRLFRTSPTHSRLYYIQHAQPRAHDMARCHVSPAQLPASLPLPWPNNDELPDMQAHARTIHLAPLGAILSTSSPQIRYRNQRLPPMRSGSFFRLALVTRLKSPLILAPLFRATLSRSSSRPAPPRLASPCFRPSLISNTRLPSPSSTCTNLPVFCLFLLIASARQLSALQLSDLDDRTTSQHLQASHQ